MVLAQLGISWLMVLTIVLATLGGYAWVIVLTRVFGVRSLAKMTSFDFAATVAVGSALASTALGTIPLAGGLLALAILFCMQYVLGLARRRSLARGVLDNQPVLLMRHGRVLESGMKDTRLSRSELMSQLRIAGIRQLDEVGAVVMETTGEISVLRAGDLSDELLEGVRHAT